MPQPTQFPILTATTVAASVLFVTGCAGGGGPASPDAGGSAGPAGARPAEAVVTSQQIADFLSKQPHVAQAGLKVTTSVGDTVLGNEEGGVLADPACQDVYDVAPAVLVDDPAYAILYDKYDAGYLVAGYPTADAAQAVVDGVRERITACNGTLLPNANGAKALDVKLEYEDLTPADASPAYVAWRVNLKQAWGGTWMNYVLGADGNVLVLHTDTIKLDADAVKVRTDAVPRIAAGLRASR